MAYQNNKSGNIKKDVKYLNKDFGEFRNNLIEYTRILDRLLRSGKWMIPLFHDPLHRIAHQAYIAIPDEVPLYGFNPWTAWKK